MTSEMQERIARALVISRGAALIASDEHWPKCVQSYREMCADWPAYANGRSLITDAFRDALAVMKAMREPTRPMVAAAFDAKDHVGNALSRAAEGGFSSGVMCAWAAMLDAEITLAEGVTRD